MYLKRIELRGFKSFAEKTIVEFQQGVTCIVGPNGSGKSNITDAIRWVLGEQRAKTLRGSKMEDVIFGGTKHRKPLGMAEVKLIFDNREKFFPLDYDEVEIIRRVFRSGDSEYSINGMNCRLKDIRELLMDTGIGREGYSIIGQGKIDEILSGGKDERRLLFEEAAGILKYKTRKQEAVRKLDNTKDNLSRIEDIISEISDRVEPLKIESQRAQTYLDLSEQLRKIELYDFGKRYVGAETALVNALEELQKLSDTQETHSDDYDRLKKDYDETEQKIFEFNRQLRQLETTYHEKNNLKSQTAGEKSLIEEKIQNVERNMIRLKEELDEIQNQEDALDRDIQAVTEVVNTYRTKQEDQTSLISKSEKALSDLLEKMQSIKQTNETDLQVIYQKLNEIEVLKREIERMTHSNEELSKKIEALVVQVEENQTLIDQNIGQVKETESALEEIDSLLEAAQKTLSESLKLDQHWLSEREKNHRSVERLSKKINESQTELNLLETLEAEYDGYDRGVKEILTSLPNQDGIHGIVASLINVPKKYETAIEVALGRSIQHIVCETDGHAKEAIEFLRINKLGRVTFLPLNQVRGNGQQKDVIQEAKKEKGYIGVASDLIECPDQYDELVQYLLGRIVIVEDFETARKLLKIKNIKYKVITLVGDVLIPGGTITGGSFKSKMTNILGRKRRIEQLASDIDQFQDQMAHENKVLDQIEYDLSENKKRLSESREEIDKLRMKRVSVEHLSDQHRQMVSMAEENQQKNIRNLDLLKEEFQEETHSVNEKTELIKVYQLEVDALEEAVKDYKKDVESLEAESRKLNEDITAKRIELASFEQDMTFRQRELKRLCDDLETVKVKSNTRKQLLKDEEDKKDAFFDKVDDIETTLVKIGQEVEQIFTDRQAIQSTKDQASNHLKTLTTSLTACSSAIENIKAKSHQLELKKVKFEVEKETIVSELWDKYEMGIAEVVSNMPDEPVTGNIKSLKSEIRNLGNVNIKAIEEYAEVAERYEFLTGQRDDLEKASNQLLKIISDLEKQMTEIFVQYFQEIAIKFKETFKALFNGGDASVVLADEEDILNSEIEIIAQPPGKKLQNLNLLSGGEKALTAIALLFAILKTKPTPFCVLDEIEAALDDVNVYRFAEFIQDYAVRSQFVVITHRKGTMEVADTLYGVTMAEYGISKVLSVKLEDVGDQYSA